MPSSGQMSSPRSRRSRRMPVRSPRSSRSLRLRRLRAGRSASSPAARAAFRLLAGPAPLDALGGEVLVRRPALVFVLVGVVRVSVVIVVLIITPGVAAATLRPRRLTTQERHSHHPAQHGLALALAKHARPYTRACPRCREHPLSGTGS